MRTALGLLAALAIVGPATAQPAASGGNRLPAARCAAIATQFDAAVKRMALLSIEGRSEDSTLRATTRATELANLLAENQTRLLQMSAGGCPPYAGPVGSAAYDKAAAACRNAVRAKDDRAFLEGELARTGRLPNLGPGKNAQAVLDAARAAPDPAIACDPTTWIAAE